MARGLQEIFGQLKKILDKYEGGLEVSSNYGSRYEVEFDKDYETRSLRTGRVSKKHGLYFAGVIIQSNYVGFYFMPIYSNAKEFGWVSQRLRKMLKGKSCFHVREWDSKLEKEIGRMVGRGCEMYKKM